MDWHAGRLRPAQHGSRRCCIASTIGKEHGLQDPANIFHAGDGHVHPTFLYDDHYDCEQLQNTLAQLNQEFSLVLHRHWRHPHLAKHGWSVSKNIHLMPYQFDEPTMAISHSVKDALIPA